MKDYAYYIPGYTGFCPELSDHFGESYGKATKKIIRDRPHLRDRLSAVHYHRRSDDERNKFNIYTCENRKAMYHPEYLDHYEGMHRMKPKEYVMAPIVDYEYRCPKHMFVDGCPKHSAGFWNAYDRGDSLHVHHPAYRTQPCPHGFHVPSPCARRRICKRPPDVKIQKKPRILPHRQAGVIPKYTGHIPGMQFTFGEAYGSAADRLLRRHHDTMMQLKRHI
ncbi:uncharacterized protein LOC118201002 [Stegodyphus dumicola]|uniref:uncharacterized protein LOC118201002 n=1 Tax=Stegodyphus dumicola TaxID=202533 RepID=UPI0015AFAFD2|nr:uncharacterized protein LOC118201002 [Stegodyphus dumicola]